MDRQWPWSPIAARIAATFLAALVRHPEGGYRTVAPGSGEDAGAVAYLSRAFVRT